jgi:hypothetical protein
MEKKKNINIIKNLFIGILIIILGLAFELSVALILNNLAK